MKYIKIFKGLYVNLEQITAFDFLENESQIVIYPGDESGMFVVEYSDSYPNGEVSGRFRYVKSEDFHRIKRELCEFFEIEDEC